MYRPVIREVLIRAWMGNRKALLLTSMPSKEIKNGHTNGNAVFDLIKDNGMITICYIRSDFHTTIYRPWVHDNNFLVQCIQYLLIQLIKHAVFTQRREISNIFSIQLNAKHIRHVTQLQPTLTLCECHAPREPLG